MSDISPISPGAPGAAAHTARNGVTPPPHDRAIEVKSRPSERLADSVELSARARYIDQLRQLPDVRQDVVNSIKQAIDADTYSIDDKLNLAIDRMMDDLAE